MSKRSSGFIQLEWECPQCDARNPGPEGSCLSCGAPQPDDVEFVAPAERKFIKDEKMLKHAKAGADIYCAFCETRNAATAETCSQCGAELAEGEKRKAGAEVRQRAAAKMVNCPNCEAENPSSNSTCQECGAPLERQKVASAQFAPKGKAAAPSQKDAPKKRHWIIGVILLLIACCIGGLFFFFSPSEDITGTVSDVRWETSISVQEEQEVRHNNERGSAPSGAYDVSCHTESEETCTERTVDQGNGFAEVVQDCTTSSEEYCSYSMLEWQTLETLTLDGSDYNPRYAEPSLATGQRLGGESADYSVNFSTEKGLLEYSPSDLTEYQQFQLGSDWTLSLNRLGNIVSVGR
ncbi:MAG: hypothetical protein HN855_05170 [Anaerolineae bacterium]|jgi:hypothetical protein|nr:hypothetical protein [Anaerolineae bacterium]MBT7069610.1 hypothetical protein [Anaerolineae bacterium]MBT7324529.1 hypothetical protein [Anaerolineae bacterium]